MNPKLTLLLMDNFQSLNPKDGHQGITFSAYFDPFISNLPSYVQSINPNSHGVGHIGSTLFEGKLLRKK
jgi:hypothetical protein